jgi:hypothetical protein
MTCSDPDVVQSSLWGNRERAMVNERKIRNEIGQLMTGPSMALFGEAMTNIRHPLTVEDSW